MIVDAAAFFPHIPRSYFPAEVLGAERRRECGVRGAGLGALAFMEEDERTGAVTYPSMELFRLAIPWRVYTNRHMDVVAEGFKKGLRKARSSRGAKAIISPEIIEALLGPPAAGLKI